MKKKYIYIILLFCLQQAYAMEQQVIGLCMVATGKYIQFVKPLIESAEKYFCPEHHRTYFVFTDNKKPLYESNEKSPNIIYVYQERLGWPYDTLMRFDIYLKNKHIFDGIDYIFAIDADMRFVDYEGDEILGKRVGTQHPGYVGKRRLPYERNKKSTAYVARNEGSYYFAGGFYGAHHDEFFHMLMMLMQQIRRDLARNYIATWHDESHLNRFFIDYPPTIILDCSYCYPEHGREMGYPACNPKLLALDKDHASMRE